MPYTLSMAFMWVTLAVALGIVIGWLMRSVVAKRQIERARANHLDNVELERLRARVAELEPERNVLRDERDAARAELERLDPAPTARPDDGSTVSDAVAPVAVPTTGSNAVPANGPTNASTNASTTVESASSVLGRDVVQDDLTVIDGIGPKVAELCSGIGITTWSDLAATEVSLLRTMLHDAGPRFRTHDPSSWPEQARLLADGRWEEFRARSQEHAGGRLVD